MKHTYITHCPSHRGAFSLNKYSLTIGELKPLKGETLASRHFPEVRGVSRPVLEANYYSRKSEADLINC